MSLTLKEMDEAIDRFFELKEKYTVAKKESDRIHSELQYAYSELAQKMEAEDMHSYKGKRGLFSYRYEESVQTPKTIEDKQALAAFLREHSGEETFWDSFSVNSQRLQTLYKEYNQIAEDDGELDFSLPGTRKGEPQLRFSLRKTGEKK